MNMWLDLNDYYDSACRFTLYENRYNENNRKSFCHSHSIIYKLGWACDTASLRCLTMIIFAHCSIFYRP